jgi:hypothetical protein
VPPLLAGAQALDAVRSPEEVSEMRGRSVIRVAPLDNYGKASYGGGWA